MSFIVCVECYDRRNVYLKKGVLLPLLVLVLVLEGAAVMEESQFKRLWGGILYYETLADRCLSHIHATLAAWGWITVDNGDLD